MSRHRNRNRRKNHPQNTSFNPVSPPPELPARSIKRVVGMFSVKTIRNSQGMIIVRQGEIITEEVLQDKNAEDVWEEIEANAMASRKG